MTDISDEGLRERANDLWDKPWEEDCGHPGEDDWLGPCPDCAYDALRAVRAEARRQALDGVVTMLEIKGYSNAAQHARALKALDE